MIFFMINPPSYLCHHQRFLLLTHTSYERGSEFFNRFLPGIGMGSRLFVWIHLSQDRFFGGVFFTMNMKPRETGMLPYDCQTICNQPGCFYILVFMILLLPDQYPDAALRLAGLASPKHPCFRSLLLFRFYSTCHSKNPSGIPSQYQTIR